MDLFIVSISIVIMNTLLVSTLLHFFLFAHVLVLTRALVLLGVTCLNEGFDLI